MKKTLGYIVFVSYNRTDYSMQGIEFDDMSFKDFVKFYNEGNTNLMSVHVKEIKEDTFIEKQMSDAYDDGMYWFVPSVLERLDYIRDFIFGFIKH